MDNLEGRVAVVTGGASGLGRAMAERFAAEGMRVVLADIERAPLEEVTSALAALGHQVKAVVTDVSRCDDIERLATTTVDTFGAVHVVCNNAGVVKAGRSWELTLDDWRWVIDVDLWSVIYGIRAFVPRMLAQNQGGHIVSTASMAGLLPFPNLGAYDVAKSGVVALSEALHLELAAEDSDIGVSVLCPGFIATRIAESERNRPGALSDTTASRAPRTTQNAKPTMNAADVAAHVIDAVRTGRFWVLTHDGYRAVIQQRAYGIGTDAKPTPPPIL